MLVSVLINNYNYARFLDDCLNSVLNQTYSNIEIIVYDDGSSDDSIRVLEKYKDKIKILAYANFGEYPSFNQANSINQAFEESKGEIICLLDADDMFMPEKIEKIVTAFEQNPDSVLVQHIFDEIDEHNMKIGIKRPFIKNVQVKEYIFKTHNLLGLFAQTSALSFKREYLLKVLPILKDRYIYVWSDVRLTRQAIFFGEVVTLNQALGMYRVHGKNDSHKLRDSDYYSLVLDQMYDFFNAYSKKYNYVAINRQSSINKMTRNKYEYVMAILFSKELLVYKLQAIRKIFIRLIGKIK